MSEKIAALRVERRALADGKPHPRNPRIHPEPGSPKWDAMRASLAFDYFDPLVLNERNGMWVSGHFRVKVLMADQFTHADIVLVDYDEPTHVARMIAANTLIGQWEEGLLSQLAAELSGSSLAASLAALTEEGLALLAQAPSVSDDTAAVQELMTEAEQLAVKWNVLPGELFAAGPHRILCGDCRSEESWRRLLGERLADMVWTDPPYNVDYHGVAGGDAE